MGLSDPQTCGNSGESDYVFFVSELGISFQLVYEFGRDAGSGWSTGFSHAPDIIAVVVWVTTLTTVAMAMSLTAHNG